MTAHREVRTWEQARAIVVAAHQPTGPDDPVLEVADYGAQDDDAWWVPTWTYGPGGGPHDPDTLLLPGHGPVLVSRVDGSLTYPGPMDWDRLDRMEPVGTWPT